MKNNLAAAPPRFPPAATLLLVLGVLLTRFLPPLLGPVGLAPAAGRAVALGTLAAGGYLALRHYWSHDKPMFWRKLVLLALALVSMGGLYILVTYAGIHPVAR